MPNSFYKVNHSLQMDRGTLPVIATLTAIALLAAWMTWAFRARLTRYEVSDSARLEVAGAASVLQSSVSGDVRLSNLNLGATVQQGDVLVELDNTSQRLALAEEKAHRFALAPQLQALKSKMQSEDFGRADEQTVLSVSTQQALAQYRDSEAQAQLAAQEAARSERLRREGLISEADAQRAIAAAAARKANAESLKLAAQRLQPELALRDTDRNVRRQQILSDIAKLEADCAQSDAAIHQLAYQVERQIVRAPMSGKLTECATLHPGAHLTEGQRLGVILPRGGVEVVADFNPASALGKLHPGQDALVRLTGFPWAHFGLLHARVSRVAGDLRDGKVRVELALNPNSTSIPLQHGLPGSVQVETERVSPAALLLRSAGQAVGSH